MWKVLGVAAIVVAMALPAKMALSTGEDRVQAASGTVVAVTEASKTIVVESTLGGKPWIIGGEVTDRTRFEGKAKKLQDLKAGGKVTIQWVREDNRLAVRTVTLR